jgi:hypothetical protein
MWARILYRTVGLVAAAWCLSAPVSRAAAEAGSTVEPRAPGSSTLTMSYEDGRLSASLKGVALEQFARRLNKETGAEVKLVGEASNAKATLWANVEDLPLRRALDEILKGYSYSSYPVAGSDAPKVVIYVDSAGATQADSQSSEYAKVQVPEGLSGTEAEAFLNKAYEDSVPAELVDEPSAALEEEAPVPVEQSAPATAAATAEPIYSLDDVMPLPDYPEPQAPAMAGAEGSGDANWSRAWQARQQAVRDARIGRSLNLVSSENPRVRAMALDELEASKDPRATPGIASVAARESLPVQERLRATEALWRHAGDLQFSDPGSVQALRQLTQDEDPEVARMAREAIADMERYRGRQR